MARSALIPLRPKDFSTNLTQAEMATLTWYVLSDATKKEAFLIFCRPDMLSSKAKAAIDDYVKQFYARKECLDYIEAYQQTIEEFIHPVKKDKPKPSGTLEEKKGQALTKLVEYVLSEANNIDTAEDPKAILDFANKIGLFDMEEEVEEQPRRYLPTSCLSGCAYRMFCEENTEDMCQYCKYHEYGEENGVHYEKENILDVPISSGTEFANE